MPLIWAPAFGRTAIRLHPVLIVDDQPVIMEAHLIAAVHRRSLGAIVASLADKRDTIIAAIDVLWSAV